MPYYHDSYAAAGDEDDVDVGLDEGYEEEPSEDTELSDDEGLKGEDEDQDI